MTIMQYFLGCASVELTSGDLEQCFSLAQENGIQLTDIQVMAPLTARLIIDRKNIQRLKTLCEKRGDRIRILRRKGLFWSITALIHRPLLTTGLLLIAVFFLFLPTRILFIKVEGNRKVPSHQILQAAESSGLRFGVSRKTLRSEQVKNKLLQHLPSLSWAGVNTRGCTATLTVAERNVQKEAENQKTVTGIYSVEDGIIDTCTALEGTMLCKPGQAVSEGQLLISGYTDCGSKLLAGQARGEVFAKTNRQICAVIPENHQLKGPPEGIKRHFSLVLGKKRIKFPCNSGIWDAGCGRMYEEYCVTLPGGYVLPIALAADVYTISSAAPVSRQPGTAQKVLAEVVRHTIYDQMIAGEVLKEQLQYKQESGYCALQGHVLCREMIGRSRQEKIGE